jgi:hypothetical protein
MKKPKTAYMMQWLAASIVLATTILIALCTANVSSTLDCSL